MAKKKNDWLDALRSSGIEVKSAKDAMQVKGYLDTGNYALNWAISGQLLGGYPLGHTVEISGDPFTGKSYLAARAVAMAQQRGGVALLDDTEGGYNMDHIERLGVVLEELAYRNSRTVKEHLATVVAFIKAFKESGRELGIAVCDSLAQLSTDHELKEQLEKRDMTKAAELKAFFRIIGTDLLDLPVLYISTNHTIANIGNMFQKRTTPGGGGPKFNATVRLDLRATSKVRKDSEVVGAVCRAVTEKNRITAPWKEVRLAIPFEGPISRASGLVPLLQNFGVLRKVGQFLYYDRWRVGRLYKSKDRFLDQDEIGEQMLDRYPAILEETDAMLSAGNLGSSGSRAVMEDLDAEDEEEDDE